MTCKWCKGRGTNHAEYGPVPCADCGGSGYIVCMVCGDGMTESQKICDECREKIEQREREEYGN